MKKIFSFIMIFSPQLTHPQTVKPFLEKNDGYYNSPMFVEYLPSGKLIQVYGQSLSDGGPGHGIISMRYSLDEGLTFSQPATIVSGYGAYQVNAGTGGVSHTGRIIVAYSLTDTLTGAHFINQYTRYSDDEGVTWSSPYLLSHLSNTTLFNPYGRVNTIEGDSLLLTWYGFTNNGSFNSYAVKSGDNGATWGHSISIVSDDAVQYTEACAIYLSGGFILGLVRKNNLNAFTQVLSTDNGNTFTVIGDVPFGYANDMCWLSRFAGSSGEIMIECVYSDKASNRLNAIYGYANDLIANGVKGWNSNSFATIAKNDSFYLAYPVVAHHNNGPAGIVMSYKHRGTYNASLVGFRLPGNAVPITTTFRGIITPILTGVDNSLKVQSNLYVKPTPLTGGAPWTGYSTIAQIGSLFLSDYQAAAQGFIGQNVYFNGIANKYSIAGHASSINFGDGSGNIIFNVYNSGNGGAAVTGIGPAFGIYNNGNIRIGSGIPATKLHVSGAVTYDTTPEPPDPAAGKCVTWFDGVNFKIKKNVGGTVTSSTIF